MRRPPNLEQELILVARAVGEIATRLEQLGEPLTGVGVRYARRLVVAADAGTRGIDPAMIFPAVPSRAPDRPTASALLEAEATTIRLRDASTGRP